MSPNERSAYLSSAERKLEKCRDLASRPGDGSPWTGDEEREKVRQQRIMHATEGLLCATLALASQCDD
ncbi:hypothetical protein GCM10009689_17160 [Brevibacterium antiquum]